MTDPVTPPPDPMPPVEPMPAPPPPAPAPPPPPVVSGAGRPADVGPRLIARLIDGVAIWIILIILGSILSVGIFAFGSGFDGIFLLFSVIAALLVVGYFALMESNMGQTLGKMVVGVRTEGPSGGKPTFEQALKRNAWYALYIIPILGWLAVLGVAIYILITINNSPARMGWHDKFAGGTRVVTTK